MRKEVNKFKKKITGGTYDKGRYPSAAANINRARRHGLLTDKEDEKLKDLAAIYFGWSKPKQNLKNRVKRGSLSYRPRTRSNTVTPKKKKTKTSKKVSTRTPISEQAAARRKEAGRRLLIKIVDKKYKHAKSANDAVNTAVRTGKIIKRQGVRLKMQINTVYGSKYVRGLKAPMAPNPTRITGSFTMDVHLTKSGMQLVKLELKKGGS